jgi:23S rRNA U2552 (ribose-2'-O)-methylase RlmE/FtsJ
MEKLRIGKYILSESTKSKIDENFSIDLENASDDEVNRVLLKSGEFVTKLTESGEVEIKRVLKG